MTITFNVKNIGNARKHQPQTAILISSPNSIPITLLRKLSLETCYQVLVAIILKVVFQPHIRVTSSGDYSIIVNLNYEESTSETDYLNNIASSSIYINHEPWAAQKYSLSNNFYSRFNRRKYHMEWVNKFYEKHLCLVLWWQHEFLFELWL